MNSSPSGVEPEAIAILKLTNKSTVYRLAGVGPDGSAVVGKRCRAATARIESIIHQEFLAHLPLPALRCYGFVEEPDGEFCWLFLEEAVGQEYSPLDAEHRALAGRWLAAVHTAAIKCGLQRLLPVREPSHYLNLLQASINNFRQHLANPALRADDLETLRALVLHGEALVSRWSALEETCAGIPRALTHGDFVIKNVRVRSTQTGLALLVFDWEVASWGVPATDFAQFIGRTVSPDIHAYCSSEGSPLGSDIRSIQKLAICGKFFRLIYAIHWATSLLEFKPYEFLAKPMSCLKRYESRAAEALIASPVPRRNC